MAKKKIVKLTDKQYFDYIMGLKEEPALFDADGKMPVPDIFTTTEDDKKGE